MNLYPIRLGSVVSHAKDRSRFRSRGVVVEVHPFGEFQVKWDRVSRPETVRRDDLNAVEAPKD